MVLMTHSNLCWRSWDAGNGLPGMTANYLAAMNAIYAVRPTQCVPACWPGPACLRTGMLPSHSEHVVHAAGWPYVCAQGNTARAPSKAAWMQVNSGTLFMVQGLAQQGLAVCWGDGFAVDQAQLDMYTGDYTASGFFDQLLSQPYVDNVIISVHYYGPSISKNTDRCLSMTRSAVHAASPVCCGAGLAAQLLFCTFRLSSASDCKPG